MSKDMRNTSVRSALNTYFADMDAIPSARYQVLAKAKGEVKVKKKLSVGLILAIVLILAVVTSLAVGLTSYFKGFAAPEDTYGKYEKWPADAKVELVQLMLDSGVIAPDTVSEWTRLSGEDKKAAADSILEEYFEDFIAIDTYNVMLSEPGQTHIWPYEAKALYSSILMERGKQKQSWDLFLLPDSDDISLDHALSIAKTALMEKFYVSRAVLDGAVLGASFYQKGVKENTERDEPVWLLEFYISEGDAYRVELTRHGDVLMYSAPGVLTYYPDEDIMENVAPVAPSEHDASAEQVILQAKEALLEGSGCSEYDLANMSVQARFICDERFCNGWEPVWLVEFYRDNALAYKLLYGYDGSFIDMAEADVSFDNTHRQGMYLEDSLGFSFMSLGFWEMSTEERMEFSREWNPVIDAYAANHPYYSRQGDLFYSVTRYTYGLPEADDMTQEDAIALGRQQIVLLGAEEQTAIHRPVEAYFDVTTPERPLWKLVFFSVKREHRSKDTKPGDSDLMLYRVVLNARTADVIEAFIIDNSMDLLDYRQ